MAQSTYVVNAIVDCAPGVTFSNPTVSVIQGVGDFWLDSIEIRIPPGHLGLTGLQILNAGTNIVPYGNQYEYLVGNDDLLRYDVGVEVDTGLGFSATNADIYYHYWYLRLIGRPMALQVADGLNTAVTVVPVTSS
jgi:hypothetical protein